MSWGQVHWLQGSELQAWTVTESPHIELPRKPRRGEQMEVTVDRLNERGHGVGRLFARCGPGSSPRWLEFVVPRTLPEERVVGEVKRVHRNRFELRVIERLSSSPNRQSARCEHFEVDAAGLYCGGCALQHLSYPEQLAAKASRVARLLTDVGVAPSLIEPPVGVDDPWFYRNKMEYSFGTETDGRYALGLHPPGRRWDILRLETCLLQSEASAELMRAARQWGEVHRVRHFHPATGQGWLPVNNSVFSEKYALSGSARFDHVPWRPISTIRIGIDSIVGLKD